jgi:hypothetical protein
MKNKMNKYFKLLVGVVIIFLVGLISQTERRKSANLSLDQNLPAPANVPSVSEAIEFASLELSEIKSEKMRTENPTGLNSRSSVQWAKSSFFSNEDLNDIDLSEEESVALQILLGSIKIQAFSTLLKVSEVETKSNGNIAIQYTSNPDLLKPYEDYLHYAVRELLGDSRYTILSSKMDQGFAAKFNYFGKYSQYIEIGFIGAASDVADSISINSRTDGVSSSKNSGTRFTVTSTSVLERESFEREFFPISQLKGTG